MLRAYAYYACVAVKTLLSQWLHAGWCYVEITCHMDMKDIQCGP